MSCCSYSESIWLPGFLMKKRLVMAMVAMMPEKVSPMQTVVKMEEIL